jgi:hypothetical protein
MTKQAYMVCKLRLQIHTLYSYTYTYLFIVIYFRINKKQKHSCYTKLKHKEFLSFWHKEKWYMDIQTFLFLIKNLDNTWTFILYTYNITYHWGAFVQPLL